MTDLELMYLLEDNGYEPSAENLEILKESLYEEYLEEGAIKDIFRKLKHATDGRYFDVRREEKAKRNKVMSQINGGEVPAEYTNNVHVQTAARHASGTATLPTRTANQNQQEVKKAVKNTVRNEYVPKYSAVRSAIAAEDAAEDQLDRDERNARRQTRDARLDRQQESQAELEKIRVNGRTDLKKAKIAAKVASRVGTKRKKKSC